MTDGSLYLAINGLAGHIDQIDDAFEAMSRFIPFVLIALLLVAWFAPGPESGRYRRQLGTIAATLGASVALGVNQVIIRLWDRPRPFISHHATMLLAPSRDPSFPSDHATFGFAIAAALLIATWRLGVVALLLAAVMAFARVYVGEHYVSDVIGGALVGTTFAVLAMLAVARLAWLVDPPLRLARRFHLA
jgi:undecaprenyl-diphosphatase